MNNHEVISVVNNLIETCRRGQNVFRNAAEGIQNSEFRRLFNIFSQQRAQFITELQSEVHRLGGEAGKSDEGVTPPDKTIPFRQPAAKPAGIRHFVYVSVAHPAPMMHAYIAVRSECEAAIESAGLNATILRPWYVLGPGHQWPYLLLPIYKIAEWIPQTRKGAQRLGLVTLEQMLNALTFAVENPVQGIRLMGVPEIRAATA